MYTNTPSHGIRDNHTRGTVADFLAEKIATGSQLSMVSAYFTIYAYDALSKQLDQIEHLNFLFGEPRFTAALDPDNTDKKAFKIEDEGLELANRLHQKEIAYQDFIAHGGEQGAKEAGRMRAEGKDYVVQDGDVLNFLFNV